MNENRSLKAIKIIRIFMVAVVVLAVVFAFLAQRQEVKSYMAISAFTAILMLALSFIPVVLQNSFKILMPASIQLFIVVFVLLAQFFGEILKFYDRFWWWDVMLHTSSGLLLGIMGVLLVYSLNIKNDAFKVMHHVTIMLFAFCFALAAGAVWELFEFSGDYLLGMNMQRSVYVFSQQGTPEFASEALDYFNNNVKYFDGLEDGKLGRVFDPGLMDTMEDFIVDSIGAIVAVIGITIFLKKERHE